MEQKESMHKMPGMSYGMFAVMMLISFVIMYAVMFLNVAEADHIYLSITRTYMSLLMVSAMAILMMLMMGKMYSSKKVNTAIIAGAIVVFILILTGLRTQTPIGDVQYMKAMIPHHSSAIMVSEHANIQNPEVKKLSEGIIASQEREIAEMKALIEKLGK